MILVATGRTTILQRTTQSLRWLQWGTHAPILRTHPQPDPLVERRPYGYALPIATYMGDAMRRRGQLVPTLASALRAFETTAVSPIRGLYTDYPEQAGTYFYNDTFVLCDSMVVAPVTVNVTNSTQIMPTVNALPFKFRQRRVFPVFDRLAVCAVRMANSRSAIFAEHKWWTQVLLYYLANDPEHAKIQPALVAEMKAYGRCADEYVHRGVHRDVHF